MCKLYRIDKNWTLLFGLFCGLSHLMFFTLDIFILVIIKFLKNHVLGLDLIFTKKEVFLSIIAKLQSWPNQ